MPDLQSALEEYISGLPPEEWRALACRVRPADEPMPPLPRGGTDD